MVVKVKTDPKSAQAQMRHPSLGPTLEIYAQTVKEKQRRTVIQLIADMNRDRQKRQSKRCSDQAPIGTFWNITSDPTVCNLLDFLVELVGIEPTTSSLRTMRSPS